MNKVDFDRLVASLNALLQNPSKEGAAGFGLVNIKTNKTLEFHAVAGDIAEKMFHEVHDFEFNETFVEAVKDGFAGHLSKPEVEALQREVFEEFLWVEEVRNEVWVGTKPDLMVVVKIQTYNSNEHHALH